MTSRAHRPQYAILHNAVKNALLYVFLFGFAVVIFQFTDSAWRTEAGIAHVAMVVSAGAAISATVILFITSGKLIWIPSKSEWLGLVPTILAVGLSSVAFWAVSIHASILLAAVAQPLRVLVETGLAARFFPASSGPFRRDRFVFDIFLGLILLYFVQAGGHSGLTLGIALPVVLILIAIGTTSELLLMRLQIRALHSNIHPAGRVALLNWVLTLAFLAASMSSNAPFFQSDGWLNTVLLVLVGAIGTAGPSIAKLKLIGEGHSASDISILALGLPGGIVVVASFGVALFWVAELVSPIPVLVPMFLELVGGFAHAFVAVLVLVFVLTRFWSDVGESGHDGDVPEPSALAAEDHSADTSNVFDADWAKRVRPDVLLSYSMAYEGLVAARKPEAVRKAMNRVLITRRDLGHAGFQHLPVELLSSVWRRMDNHPSGVEGLRNALMKYQYARREAQQAELITEKGGVVVAKMEQAYRNLLRELHTSDGTLPIRLVAQRFREATLSGAILSVRLIARGADPVAAISRSIPGRTGVEVWGRALADILTSYVSTDALMKSGLEASIGFRFVIPGTGGLLANVGGWIMAFTGTLAGYLTRSNPMLLNPGVTLATPFWIWTLNRPGVGMGPSLPFGNAYLDAQRYKLLLGADGVGYVRIGHWEGRGPYGTVSGSFPLFPGLRGTWNVSLFSPGLSTVVARSTPLARWVRAKSEQTARRFAFWRS